MEAYGGTPPDQPLWSCGRPVVLWSGSRAEGLKAGFWKGFAESSQFWEVIPDGDRTIGGGEGR